MTEKKNIFIIIGSASESSANARIIEHFAVVTQEYFNLTIGNDLKILPHFNPDLSTVNTPETIIKLRKEIEKADGVLICTPEYIFSIPSGLKNAIEWLVSTTVFSDKPTGLITASASGEKGHEELQLIMNTIGAKFNEETTLLIQGVKGKINEKGQITDPKTETDLNEFAKVFRALVNNTKH